MSKFNHFLGTQEHEFHLKLGGIRALQEKLKMGFGEIASKIVNSKWAIDDILEVVRFGLIGGGMPPKEADTLVSSLLDLHPITEITQVATSIVLVALVGVEKDPVGKLQKEVETMLTATSPSQPFTEQVASSAAPQE